MKLYNEKQATVSATLGGPIAAGILIYLNYKRLGLSRAAVATIIFTIVFTTVFFALLMSLPDEVVDKVPSLVFTALWGLLVYGFFYLFADNVRDKLDTGTPRASNWSVAGYTLLGLIINIAIVIVLATFKAPYPGVEVEYDGNYIFYNEEDVERGQADFLAERLYQIGYFEQDANNVVHLDYVRGEYIVTIPVLKDLWEDAEIIEVLTMLKYQLRIDLGNTTIIKLEDYNITGKVEYKFI